jgi:HEAT repeat protein
VHSDEPTLPEALDEALLRAGFAQGDDAETLLRVNLNARGPRHRVLALRGCVRHALLSSDDWLGALGDEDLDVRREALTLVAYEKVTDPSVFAAIIAALADPDPLVVDAAAFALGEHLRVDAVEALSEVATSHDDARCREAAVAALGAIGDDRGRPAVLGALDDKAPVRRRAIVALSNFEGPDIEAALERAGEDRDWQVRAAVNQLARENED